MGSERTLNGRRFFVDFIQGTCLNYLYVAMFMSKTTGNVRCDATINRKDFRITAFTVTFN